MIIEWNAHMFSGDSGRYPFHPRAAYRPGAERLSLDPLADYEKRMAEEGIDRAVLVHPEPYGDDHRLVLDCLRRGGDRFRGTCLFYPKDADGPKKMADLVASERRIIATRFHAHRGKEQYLDRFTDPGVVALWEKAGDLGLVVELHIGPNYARQVDPVIGDHPEVPVLIDHLAEPHMGTGVEFADVLELARHDHVFMKLSGLNHFSKDTPLYAEARPFTRRVVEAFGPDHLVWGSGTPEIVDAHLDRCTSAERAKVKGGNIGRLLGWGRT
jgi:predicted TIM-barrel fold metal-dependent hydrolase